MKTKTDSRQKLKHLSDSQLRSAFIAHHLEPMPYMQDALDLIAELGERGFDVSVPEAIADDDCPLCMAARVDWIARKLMAH